MTSKEPSQPNSGTSPEALLDIRKSLRVLHAYSQRIFDINRCIVAANPNWHFLKAYNPHTNFISGIKSSPVHTGWMWDLLPMADISFIFACHKPLSEYPDNAWDRHPKDGDFLVEFRYCADHSLSEQFHTTSPRFLPSQLPSADKARTELLLYVFANRKTRRKEYSWLDIWREADYPQIDGGKGAVGDDIEAIGLRYPMDGIQEAADVTKMLDWLKDHAVKELQVRWARGK